MPLVIDYRDLLLRYMNHVGRCEGVDFTGMDDYREKGGDQFTDAEWELLSALARESEENEDRLRDAAHNRTD